MPSVLSIQNPNNSDILYSRLPAFQARQNGAGRVRYRQFTGRYLPPYRARPVYRRSGAGVPRCGAGHPQPPRGRDCHHRYHPQPLLPPDAPAAGSGDPGSGAGLPVICPAGGKRLFGSRGSYPLYDGAAVSAALAGERDRHPDSGMHALSPAAAHSGGHYGGRGRLNRQRAGNRFVYQHAAAAGRASLRRGA